MSKNRIVAGLGDFDKDKTVVNDAVVSEDETWSSQKIDTAKQNTLTSGVNIKTINGGTILGSGNIVIDTTANIGIESIMDVIGSIDITKSINLNLSNFSTNAHICIYNIGNDYKFLTHYYNGISSYIIPHQYIAGVYSAGTPVLMPRSTTSSAGIKKILFMSNSRLVIQTTASFYVVNYASPMSPTVGIDYSPLYATMKTSIALDGTRIAFFTSESDSTQYAGCLDIGASGVVVTYGTQVTMGIPYNNPYSQLVYANTDINKVDVFTLSSANTISAVQIKCVGIVTTVSNVLGTTGSVYYSANPIFTVGGGVYLVPSFTLNASRYVNKISFNNTSTLAPPTNALAYENVTTDIAPTRMLLVQTKVLNKYILLSANTVDNSNTATRYFIYDISLNTLTIGATSYRGVTVGGIDSNDSYSLFGKNTNEVSFKGGIATYAVAIEVSPTTAEIVAVRVYDAAASYNIYTRNINGYSYITTNGTNSGSWTIITEVTSGISIPIDMQSSNLSKVNDVCYAIGGSTLSLLGGVIPFTTAVAAGMYFDNACNYYGLSGFIATSSGQKLLLLKPKA